MTDTIKDVLAGVVLAVGCVGVVVCAVVLLAY